MTMQQTYITIGVIGAVLLGILGYGVYRDIYTTTPDTTSTTTPRVIGDLVLTGDAEVVIEEVESVNPPSLERFVVTETFSQAEKVIFIEEMKKLSALLSDDLYNRVLWLDLAATRRNAGDYKGAEEIWLFMNIAWPKDSVPYANLGNLYRSFLINYTASEKAFLTAIEYAPDNVAVYLDLHDLYRYNLDNQKMAEQILRQGLENNHEEHSLLFRLGEYYADIGEVRKAKSTYNKLLKSVIASGDAILQARVEIELDKL